MTREERIYNYPLYSIRRFPTFIRYCIPVAKNIANKIYGGGKTGYISILFDMVWCNFRYGAMDSRDYLLFEFWKKSSVERNSFFTKRRYFRLLKTFDKEIFCHPDGKAWIYKKYSDFIKREWIEVDRNTPEDAIIDFLNRHKRALVKPLSAEQGQGVFIVSSQNQQEINSFLDDRMKSSFLLEELLINCDEFNRINSSSLNTLRVFTIVNAVGKIEIPNVSLRCGLINMVVDNWGAGGVTYPVDLTHGIIYGPGVDKKGNRHIVHPGTDFPMPGFVIPRFKEACSMAREIIRKDIKVVYAGIDLAVLPDRIELIEVNFPGGHDIFQAIDVVGKNKMMQNLYQLK